METQKKDFITLTFSITLAFMTTKWTNGCHLHERKKSWNLLDCVTVCSTLGIVLHSVMHLLVNILYNGCGGMYRSGCAFLPNFLLLYSRTVGNLREAVALCCRMSLFIVNFLSVLVWIFVLLGKDLPFR